MSDGAAHHLKALTELGRLRGVSGSGGSADTAQAQRFAALLEQSGIDQPVMGVAVAINPGVNVELSPAQMEKLELAADRAAGAKLGRALVLLDDEALVLDVAERMIVSSVGDGDGLVSGIDGVVFADRSASDAGAVLPWPAQQVVNGAVAELLRQRESEAG